PDPLAQQPPHDLRRGRGGDGGGAGHRAYASESRRSAPPRRGAGEGHRRRGFVGALSANETHRAGFCAIVGRPNVGKSTLLNRLLGQKIAIVTPKPQTTRNRILGVLTLPHAQVAFVDTPGIHRARKGLNRYMVEQALGAIEEVDVVLFIVEPPRGDTAEAMRRPLGEVEQSIVRRLRRARKTIILGINKVDQIRKPLLLPLIDAWNERMDFA